MLKKNVLLMVLLIVSSLVIISAVSATCIQIQIAKDSYLPKETLQAEIDATLTRELTTNDIFLYRDTSLLPTVFFMTKITPTKYFIWGDFPSVSGTYTLKVRGMCTNGVSFAQQDIDVESTIADLYNTLPKENFKLLSLDDHILIAAAESFIPEVKTKAQNDFLTRSDSCYNKECSTEQYALSSLAFPDLRNKMIDYLIARENSLEGSWILNINSTTTQQCKLIINTTEQTINLTQGIQNITLSLSTTQDSKSLLLNCTDSTISHLIYGLKNIVKNLEEKTGKEISFEINNKYCWGSGFKTECDEESTTFAVLALKYLGKNVSNKTIEWLKQNNELIMAKAMYYMFTKDNDTLSLVLASQMYSGGWPNKIGSYVTDIPTTAITYFILKNYYPENLLRAEDRLKVLFSGLNLSEKAMTLFFVFSPDKIEPILSIWPGIVKTKSQGNFNIIFQNKGPENITVSSYFMNLTSTTNLPISSIKSLNIFVPKITTPDGRTLNLNVEITQSTQYGGIRSYRIPVILFTEVGTENINGSANITQQPINQSEQQDIINNTQNNSLQNQTTNTSITLLPTNFRFIETEIIRNITEEGNFTLTIHLANRYDQPIEQVRILSTTGLKSIMQIDPSNFDEIIKNEKKNITLKINPQFSGPYQGWITAEGKINDQSVSTNISVQFNVNLNKTTLCVKDKNGIDCSIQNMTCVGVEEYASDTYHCCLGKCKKEGGKNTAPVVIIIIVIVILLFAVLLLRKKPKKEMKDVLDEVQNKYQKRYSENSKSVSDKDSI